VSAALRQVDDGDRARETMADALNVKTKTQSRPKPKPRPRSRYATRRTRWQ
jgi:hypothetical protein